MFDETRLREALAAQRESYELLRWANEAVKERRLKFADLHHDMSASQAARSFLERNLGSLPPQARPEPDQIDEVASLRLVPDHFVRNSRGAQDFRRVSVLLLHVSRRRTSSPGRRHGPTAGSPASSR